MRSFDLSISRSSPTHPRGSFRTAGA